MNLLAIIVTIGIVFASYYILSFLMMLIFARLPRNPYDDYPDWGVVQDTFIPTHRYKMLECWIVYPDSIKDKIGDEPYRDNPAIILTHGWGRNRGRMVKRAKYWGEMGYTTILFSARDHGNSDFEPIGASIIRFSQDIDSVINWWNRPVIILGHSIGAGATILVAARNDKVKAMIAEASMYAIPENLNMIYKPVLKKLTPILVPGLKTALKFMFEVILGYKPIDYSPNIAAEKISVPALLIYGSNDKIFPTELGKQLQEKIKGSELVVIEGAGHSSIPNYDTYVEAIKNFANKVDRIEQ